MTEKYWVEFFVTSGETQWLEFESKEKLDEMSEKLKKFGFQCVFVDDDLGINFSQVTHYRVHKEGE